MTKALRIIALFLPLSACGLPTSGDSTRRIHFDTERPEYRAGEEVLAQLENRSERSIGYNLCFTTIEDHREGEWREVAIFGAGLCQLVLVELPAGAVAQSRARVPTHLAPGLHRLRTRIEMQGGREEVITAQFSIRAPA